MSEITEREYNQLIGGMEKIMQSLEAFKTEVREDLTELKTTHAAMKESFVTKDRLVSIAAWFIGTFIAVGGVFVAIIAILPKK